MTQAVVVSDGTSSGSVGGHPVRDAVKHLLTGLTVLVGDDIAAVAHKFNLEVIDVDEADLAPIAAAETVVEPVVPVEPENPVEVAPEPVAEPAQAPQEVAEPVSQPETQAAPEVASADEPHEPFVEVAPAE